MAIRLTDGHAVALERFDRRPRERVHALPAKVALSAAGETYGYPELAQQLRRRCATSSCAWAHRRRTPRW